MGWCPVETVVVTGSSGFIGRHLVQALKDNGFEVDNNSRYISRVYHLACPSTTERINADPLAVMDTILDLTRSTMRMWPNAQFINASSMGASQIDHLDASAQTAYDVAKKCMELYLIHSRMKFTNYRLPAVYGVGMHDDHFIKRCIDGRAYKPTDPDRQYWIAHIDDVVEALVKLEDIKMEKITLGEIYENFSTGQRTLQKE